MRHLNNKISKKRLDIKRNKEGVTQTFENNSKFPFTRNERFMGYR